MKEFFVCSESALNPVVEYIISQLEGHSLVALSGDLGTGKTTLVRALCEHLGVVDDVSSPTYSIINTYLTASGASINHLDLYRIENEEELVQIGIDDYLHSGEITFIEWPEILTEILPDDVLQLRLEHIADQCRKIVIL